MWFFDETYKTFEIFSLSQWIADSIIVAVIVAMIFFKKNLRSNLRLDKRLRIGFACAMLFMQTVFYLWTFSLGEQTLDLLPFGLCHLAMYLTSLTLLLNSEKLFKIVFPWAILGALLSLVIADLKYDFPHFRYFHYFGNHGMSLSEGSKSVTAICGNRGSS
jgi:hypothetical integral membrane protein (TIGR02206 family)